MRIGYLGNFSQRHCTENHLALTLESMGHEVQRIQENGITSDDLMIEIAKHQDGSEKWNLFLFTRTWGETLTTSHLLALENAGIPSASYHLDLYVGLQRKYLHMGSSLEYMLNNDPFWRTDYVFTPDGDAASAEVFKRNGVNHIYIKPGVYEPECILSGDPEHRPIDVLFVGGGDYEGSPNGYGHPEWPYRDKLITWLRQTYGSRFTKYGHPQETVRNEELNELYGNSKIVVGDSVCLPYGQFTHTHYWSDRVYETIGRGGFLIHPYIKGLEEEFTDGETIVFYEYGNFVQLKQKIDYYLEHDEERERIRRAGHELVKNHCTYRDRLAKVLEIINAKV